MNKQKSAIKTVLSVKELSRAFWSGKRWVVSALKEGALKERLFENYESADSWCLEIQQLSPCITCLSSLLKTLNDTAFNALTLQQTALLEEELSIYPLKAIRSDIMLSQYVATGEFVPCYWVLRVHPLAAIKEYRIYATDQLLQVENKKIKPLKVYTSFAGAMEGFREIRSSENMSGKLIALMGVLHMKEYDGMKVFYLSMQKEIEIIHDILDLVEILFPVFIRYQLKTRRLTFFNGSLRRILPPQRLETYRFDYFNFEIYQQ